MTGPEQRVLSGVAGTSGLGRVIADVRSARALSFFLEQMVALPSVCFSETNCFFPSHIYINKIREHWPNCTLHDND